MINQQKLNKENLPVKQKVGSFENKNKIFLYCHLMWISVTKAWCIHRGSEFKVCTLHYNEICNSLSQGIHTDELNCLLV